MCFNQDLNTRAYAVDVNVQKNLQKQIVIKKPSKVPNSKSLFSVTLLPQNTISTRCKRKSQRGITNGI